MIYFIYTIFSLFWLSIFSSYNNRSSNILTLLLSFPVIVLWIFIIGGQDNIGSDYYTYLNIFEGNSIDSFARDGEVGFAWLVECCNWCGLYGQDIFIVIAFFWAILIILISKELCGNKYIFIFFFVFITFSTAFNNQMNGIRQFIATYIFTYSMIYFIKKQYLVSFVLFVICRSFHTSILLLVPLYLALKFFSRFESRRSLSYAVLGAIFISFIFQEQWINSIINATGMYKSYIGSTYLQPINLSNKLTKLIHLPIIFFSIYSYPKFNLDCYKRKLYIYSVYLYAFMLACFSFSLTYRLSIYFTILSCIPISYLLIYLLSKKTFFCQFCFLLIVVYLLLFYGAKVLLFAQGEYAFNSVFF